MKYTLVKQLIELAEQFEQEQPDSESSLINFVAWLNHQTAPIQPMPKEQAVSLMSKYETVDSAIGKLLFFMTRYAKGYAKKALASTPLVSVDDFAYLGSLMTPDSPTKMELIERHIHEKTSGIEIIKRLLKNGLAEQFDDTADKRSKRLKITPKGREVMQHAIIRMGKVSTIFIGMLSPEEKYQLLFILNKLNQFHNPIFLHERETGLDQLVQEKMEGKAPERS